ncbi:MAG: choice-of-anchor J domain-containing protein, partial [Marinicellaceae bacterium]
IGNDDWNINLTQGMNSSHAFNTSDVGTTTDKFLISPQITLYSASILEFWHKYVFEGNATYYDGAVLEISSDLGQNWQDLGSQMTVGGYNGLLSAGNALGVREGWGGSNPSYTKVSVDLSSFAGQNVQFRWRFGADSGVGAGDWNIDDIKVIDPSVCDDNDIIFRSSFDIIN